MTKKSKSRSKVTTNSCTGIESKEENGASTLSDSSNTNTSAANSNSTVKNGRISSSKTTPAGFTKPVGNASSLASVPGIVDEFLGPKFLHVNLADRGFDKPSSILHPPPSLEEYKAKAKANATTTTTTTDNNANKVEDNATARKNKRKNKPKRKDSDHRELDPEDLSLNGNGHKSPDTIKSHLRSELSREDAERLAKQDRIRKSAFQYDGNNIVVVPQLVPGPPLCDEFQSTSYPNAVSSCYDDYNYDYDDVGAGGGARSSAPSDETSILGLDLENEDDEEERVGSWSLSHHVDYNYPPKQKPSSSVASSESENNASCSTTGSGNTTKSYPALESCTTIWDGAIQLCEIKDCSKTAGKKCIQCKAAFYCSDEHAKLNWKKHKNECVPYRVENAQGDDILYAVASRDIPAGQLIFSEKPLLIFPVADPENNFINVMDLPCIKKRFSKKRSPNQIISCCAVKPACFGCLKSVEFIGPPRFTCSKCALPLCSYNCQMDLGHVMGECRGLEAQRGWSDEHECCYHGMYMDVEILRALQLENYDYSLWEKFLQMKQNMRVETYKDSKRYRRFIKNYRELVPISAKMTGYHDDLIGNVHAIITALSFRPSLGSTYKLLFASQIFFPQSCIPNTFHYLEGYNSGQPSNFKLVTKASVPICKKELIYIDFCPTPFVCYPLRRMLLRNILCLDPCTCKRCKDPRSVGDYSFDTKCRRCHSGVICAEEAEKWEDSVWACNTCFEEFPFSAVMKIYVECREELEAIKMLPKNQIVSALKDFISRRGQRDLNEGHSIILQAWGFVESQLDSCLQATRIPGPAPRYPEAVIDEYRLLAKGGHVLERHMNAVRPGICYERGCILLRRYYAEMAISARRFAIRVITRKEYIQEILQCVKSLKEALAIFQMHDGFTSDVSWQSQDATHSLVKTKAFIQELLLTDNEESKSKRVVSSTSTFKETV